MAVSVEMYFLVNLSMDALALFVVARGRGRVSAKRLFAAAGLGAMYATLAQLPVFHILRAMPLMLMPALGMAYIALPRSGVRQYAISALSMLAGFIFLGGVQLVTLRLITGNPVPALVLGALLGGMALLVMNARRQSRLVTWEVSVYFSYRGREARFRALIDTGNRLREPISGLPVLIVERALIGDMPMDGTRHLSFGALGGSGKMPCFMPDILLIRYSDGYMKAPDIWIAAYDGIIPGGVHALAPPIAGLLESNSGSQDRARACEGGIV